MDSASGLMVVGRGRRTRGIEVAMRAIGGAVHNFPFPIVRFIIFSKSLRIG
jgi:hypothetical protein